MPEETEPPDPPDKSRIYINSNGTDYAVINRKTFKPAQLFDKIMQYENEHNPYLTHTPLWKRILFNLKIISKQEYNQYKTALDSLTEERVRKSDGKIYNP